MSEDKTLSYDAYEKLTDAHAEDYRKETPEG